MKVLVTGGCGFVGSNICSHLIERYKESKVVAFDNLKRRGSEMNIARLTALGVEFVHGDVRNADDLAMINGLDIIIDASAEPSVLAGINSSPNYLVETNFNGTLNCLNLAKKNSAKFIFLSTSRVYSIPALETLEYTEEKTRFELSDSQRAEGVSKHGITEAFSTKGYRSLYGSTKLSSELLVEEYHHLFGLETIINRCGVLTGPYQMGKVDQGVIVLWMARHFWPKPLKYIGFGGTGKQVRDILHIKDLLILLDLQIKQFPLFNGELFNVGGGVKVSTSLLELTEICQEITGNQIEIVSEPENRAADIPIYISDCDKIKNVCNWEPKYSVEEILMDIHSWIQEDEPSLKRILY